MTLSPDLFPLLAVAARANAIPAQYDLLRQRVAALTSWDDLPAQADAHGLEPLFYFHLKAADIPIPADIEQQLQARAMQHAHANQIRARALAEILEAFKHASIHMLVLKGAALAHLVYPSPGLRVMRDMDLLVRESDAERAQTMLAQIGYHAPLTADYIPSDFKHLPMAQRVVDGLTITVEVHRSLFGESHFYQPVRASPAADLETLRQTAIPFVVQGITAYTLGYEDLLAYTYDHLLEDALLRHVRLTNWADLVSIAEQFVNEIAWTRVAPWVRSALAMIHHLTPLSGELIRAAGISPADARQPHGTENFWQYAGWPRTVVTSQPAVNIPRILRDSFFPPAWWICFYYGLNKRQVMFPGRLVLHPLLLLSRFIQAMLRRVGKQGEWTGGKGARA